MRGDHMIDRTPKDGPGPKMDPRRHAYMLRFGIVRTKKSSRCITDALMMQLGACRSDSARRLLLGVDELGGKK